MFSSVYVARICSTNFGTKRVVIEARTNEAPADSSEDFEYFMLPAV